MLIPSSDESRASMLLTALETSEGATRKATNCTRFAAKEVEEAILLAWKPILDRAPQLADTLTFMVESLCQLESSLRKVNETARSLENLVRPELLRIIAASDPARDGEAPAQVAENPDPSVPDGDFDASWWRARNQLLGVEPQNPVDPA